MQSLLLGMLFYLADYVLKISTMIILVFVFIPLIIGVPVTTLIRRRLGVAGAQQLLLLIAGVGLALIAVVPDQLILICLAMAGFGLSGPQTLTNVMFGDVADDDELRSGVRREGAFFGINALITKPAQSIAITLIPLVLSATGFITREVNNGQPLLNQSATAVFGIKILIGLIPGLALILGAILLRWFPLKGPRLEKMKVDLLELHAQKHDKLTAL